MSVEPFQVLRASNRSASGPGLRTRLLIAGATGALGNEVMRQLVGEQRFTSSQVLAREPIKAGLRGVSTLVVDDDALQWPAMAADTAVVLFDPPGLFYDRERALWTPQPEQLPELARWLFAGGVRTLAVVLPHAPMRLPESLKRGLADLDEQAVAAIGFERLLIIRSAQKSQESSAGHVLARMAHWMLSVFKYMVPASEQPVRASKVAQFVALALRHAPAGIHVASSQTVWDAAQGPDMSPVVARWLAAS